jgi:hypothetical protein
LLEEARSDLLVATNFLEDAQLIDACRSSPPNTAFVPARNHFTR